VAQSGPKFLEAVIGPFDQHLWANCFNQLRRGVVIEDGDSVHPLEGGQNGDPLGRPMNGPARWGEGDRLSPSRCKAIMPQAFRHLDLAPHGERSAEGRVRGNRLSTQQKPGAKYGPYGPVKANFSSAQSEGCRKFLATRGQTLPFGECPPRSRFG